MDDIKSWGDAAKAVEAIIGVLLLVVGLFFSPRLWRALRAVGRTTTGFFRGVAMLGQDDMAGTLQALPAQLAETNRQVRALDERMTNRYETVTQLSTQLAELVERVKRVDHQVHPNGGKSLHDMVRDIASELGGVRSRVNMVSDVLRISWDALGNFGVFYANPAGENTYCSAVYLRWVNRIESQMRGWGWVNCVDQADRDAVVREWDSCVEDVRDFTMQYNLIRGDGTTMPVLVTASPLTDATGAVTMWVGVLRRITQPLPFPERRADG